MEKDNELISVVIPTYKRNKSLKRAIDSIINQTYKNIEIIVVDDNSKFPEIRKENEELINEYSEKIVLVKNKENLGGGLSRNEGIKIAKGKFIAFLDDDDEYYSNKIEEQYRLYKKLNNSNIAMIYCYADMVNLDGSIYELKKDIEGNALLENVNNCIAATSWWFCPKEKLLSVGGFENIKSRQDASLLLKLFLAGYEVYRVPKVLLKYYWHDAANGISKIDYSSVEAEKQYKEIFLKNCKKLEKEEIKQILYIFSYRIAMIYILLKDRKNAMQEYRKMFIYKKISKKSFRVLFGIIFNNIYCYLSKRKNYRRVEK